MLKEYVNEKKANMKKKIFGSILVMLSCTLLSVPVLADNTNSIIENNNTIQYVGEKDITAEATGYESNITIKVVDVTNFKITNDAKPSGWTPSFTLTADLSENMVRDPSIKYQLGNTKNMIEAVSNYAGIFCSKAIIGDTFDILEINNPEYEVFGAMLESYISQLSEGGEYCIQWDGSKWVKSAVN